MTTPPPYEVTQLLAAVSEGDSNASAKLLPLVYDELRKLAKSRMAHEASGQTLQPTALVHEAYLRLVGDTNVAWDNRGHFFAAGGAGDEAHPRRAGAEPQPHQARRGAGRGSSSPTGPWSPSRRTTTCSCWTRRWSAWRSTTSARPTW